MNVVVALYVLKVNMKFVVDLGQQVEYVQKGYIVWNFVKNWVVINIITHKLK